MASGTGVAAEVRSVPAAIRRRAEVVASAARDEPELHRCSRELQLVFHPSELGVVFYFEDRAGRLRPTYHFGHTIDVGRRLLPMRRDAFTDGRPRFLERDGRLAGLFPIDGVGDVIGVVQVTGGKSWRLRRRHVELTVARLSERLHRKAEADRQRRTLDIGLAWVAHELRGPLLAARLHLENTAVGLDPVDARSIVRTSEELSRLAANLDTILHVAVGSGTIRRRQVDLSTLVREAVRCCTAESRDDRVVIQAREPLQAFADPLHLRSAIENLIRNALHYSTPGTPVLVGAKPRKDVIVVEVRNEGPGIPPDDRDWIFEPLVRGRGGAGTGIGLFVARRVIERHGGTILYREPREGLSAFELRLPAKESR